MNKLYGVGCPIIAVFMRIFHPWRAIGLENIPEGGALLCGNHTTLDDPIYVICAILKQYQTRVLAKAELMRIPVLGWLLRKAGIIGINRGKADVAALKEAMRVLRGGEKLLIFPEGTRVREGEISQAHTGAAMLAARTNVPIVPVYIQPKKRIFKKTAVKFGTPYYPEYEGKKATPEDYQRIADDLMRRISALGAEA